MAGIYLVLNLRYTYKNQMLWLLDVGKDSNRFEYLGKYWLLYLCETEVTQCLRQSIEYTVECVTFKNFVLVKTNKNRKNLVFLLFSQNIRFITRFSFENNCAR